MITQFKVNEFVFYYYGDNKNNSYEIINAESSPELIDSKFTFGCDKNGNPMNSYYGKFDFILAEYGKNKTFIKNIACLLEEISRDGYFSIDKISSTKL